MISLTKDYQLKELVGNQGAFSYKAVHILSRHDCMVHMLSGEAASLEAIRQDLTAFREAGEPLALIRDSGIDVVITPPIENFVSFQAALADMRRAHRRGGGPNELRTGPIGKELLRILDGEPPPGNVGALPVAPVPAISDLNSGLIRKEIVQFSASGRQIISRMPQAAAAPAPAPVFNPAPSPSSVFSSAPAAAPISPSAPAYAPVANYAPTPAYAPPPAPQGPSPEAVALHWKTQELAQMRLLAISGWSVAAVLMVVLLAALLSKWS